MRFLLVHPPKPNPHPPKPPHADARCSGTVYAIADRPAAAINATSTVVVRFIILKTDITFLYISANHRELEKAFYMSFNTALVYYKNKKEIYCYTNRSSEYI
jgi:hypothetical protein